MLLPTFPCTNMGSPGMAIQDSRLSMSERMLPGDSVRKSGDW